MKKSDSDESEEKNSSNRRKIIDAQVMDDKFHSDSNESDDDAKDEKESENSRASSQRQKILQAQIMDEKVSEEYDDVEPILSEFGRSGMDELPESNQETICEIDDTLIKLREWQEQREILLKKMYEESIAASEVEFEEELLKAKENVEDESTLIIHSADDRTIASLRALMADPCTGTSQLTDLSCLDELLDRAAGGFPSPEKLRRQLREITFVRSPREMGLDSNVDLENYRREDAVIEESAALEEELGSLEARLRSFGGELDLLLHGVGGLTPAEHRSIPEIDDDYVRIRPQDKCSPRGDKYQPEP